MPIQFEGSQIMMDIPPSGIEKDGFKIIPVIPPVVSLYTCICRIMFSG